MSIEAKVRNLILENYLFTDDQSELDNNDSFQEKGIIDSTGVLELIFFLDEEFNTEVKDKEMIPENLDSVNKIISFMNKKLGN